MNSGTNTDSLQGHLALSKAGRDKGSIYVIWKQDGEYVYLVDGRYKPIEKPKKKKQKHILLLNAFDEAILLKLQNHETIRNEDIKRIIKSYKAVRNI